VVVSVRNDKFGPAKADDLSLQFVAVSSQVGVHFISGGFILHGDYFRVIHIDEPLVFSKSEH
jgi:hypothetical protein